MFWDRRIGDRRSKNAKAGDQDRAPERRDGDRRNERRQWSCGILFRTSLKVQELESWLETNAAGKWSVGLEGIDEGLNSKVLKIMFEHQEDKGAFMAAFSRR